MILPDIVALLRPMAWATDQRLQDTADELSFTDGNHGFESVGDTVIRLNGLTVVQQEQINRLQRRLAAIEEKLEGTTDGE